MKIKFIVIFYHPIFYLSLILSSRIFTLNLLKSHACQMLHNRLLISSLGFFAFVSITRLLHGFPNGNHPFSRDTRHSAKSCISATHTRKMIRKDTVTL